MDTREAFPAWGPDKPADSLESIYIWVIAKAQGQIRWYQEKRGPKRSGSKWIRGVCVFLVLLGALCPLLDAAVPASLMTTRLSQWGYVLLAIAAGLFSYDKYFGLSTGWIRYTQTELALNSALTEFRFNWLSAISQWAVPAQPRGAEILKQVQLVKEFAIRLEGLEKQETDAWVAEFQSSLAELEKAIKTTAEKKLAQPDRGRPQARDRQGDQQRAAGSPRGKPRTHA